MLVTQNVDALHQRAGSKNVVELYGNIMFVRAEYAGARTIFVNLEPMARPNPAFKEQYLGRAEDVVPVCSTWRPKYK